jgi:hydroxyacyl-ACP dehydratase HTD2-like protein with hotdog domain
MMETLTTFFIPFLIIEGEKADKCLSPLEVSDTSSTLLKNKICLNEQKNLVYFNGTINNKPTSQKNPGTTQQWKCCVICNKIHLWGSQSRKTHISQAFW